MGSIYTQDMNSPPTPTPSYSSSSTSSFIIWPIPSFWFQISKHHQSLALIWYHPVQWADGRVLENWIKEVEGAFRCPVEPLNQLSEKRSWAKQRGVWDLSSFCITSRPARKSENVVADVGGAGVSTTTHTQPVLFCLTNGPYISSYVSSKSSILRL